MNGTSIFFLQPKRLKTGDNFPTLDIHSSYILAENVDNTLAKKKKNNAKPLVITVSALPSST